MKCPKSIMVKLKSKKFSLLLKINFEAIIDFDMRNQTRAKRISIDFGLSKSILECLKWASKHAIGHNILK